MSSDLTGALMLVGFGAVSMLWLIFLIAGTRRAWQNIKVELENLKNPPLVPYNLDILCVDPHQWVEAKLILTGVLPGIYKVCSSCGCISSNSEFMLSASLLKQLKEAAEALEKKDAADKEVVDRFNALVDELVKRYVKEHFPNPDFDAFKKLLAYVREANREASEKITAEVAAQNELTRRYAGWPDRLKK